MVSALVENSTSNSRAIARLTAEVMQLGQLIKENEVNGVSHARQILDLQLTVQDLPNCVEGLRGHLTEASAKMSAEMISIKSDVAALSGDCHEMIRTLSSVADDKTDREMLQKIDKSVTAFNFYGFQNVVGYTVHSMGERVKGLEAKMDSLLKSISEHQEE